jgi:hypothetical protein
MTMTVWKVYPGEGREFSEPWLGSVQKTLNLDEASKGKIEISDTKLGSLLDELKNTGLNNVWIDLEATSIVLPPPKPESKPKTTQPKPKTTQPKPKTTQPKPKTTQPNT